ncbi:integrin alpha-6 isoform 2-T3 [Odontesthes bonariensis]|uniref:integrin alpha-6 isoform X2 n=1 Tax=Odontesthes bonariensis TaxID=219752 RepID=UPI003F5873AB
MLLQGGPSAVHAALLLLIHVLEPAAVSAFNLDTSDVIRKDGEPGTLFGFSLALHRQVNPDKVMLLIGAPKARALEKQTSNITGGLYKCEMTQSNKCERIEFDNEEDTRSENKENQWMGVTVESQGPGGKIVTCAHRYKKRLSVDTPQESHDIIGRCYVLSQDLTIDLTSDEDGGSWKFCEGRSRSHERFGTCQQGLAATFTKDYHYVVFGAPGAYNWKGVVRVEQKNNTLLDLGVYDDGPYEVGDAQVFDTTAVPVPANSYLGFSLDSGHHITRSRGLTVVAGAPRANHSGAVVLLKKGGEASGSLLVEHILYGPGLASGFGYDVAVVDLNGDGWQDIVVGAPQFYMKASDIGGAVYVYINMAGQWESVKSVRLNGTKDSMFGLAVKNTGDINKDSYEDIAVGAPNDDDGAGKVYIYHGSAHGIKAKPAQILSGKAHNIRFFGYSLAGNMDLDGNSYPDLAVGSLSDTALIYRARPVIKIWKDIKVSPQEIDLTKKTCGNYNCFNVSACFYYQGNHESYNPRLTISYSVEADGDRRKLGLTSRAVFLSKSLPESDYQLNGTIDLLSRNRRNCINIKARLKGNIRDKMRSISIEVSAKIIGVKRQTAKNGLPLLMPILDSSQPSKSVTEVNFVKEGCSEDHVCRSNLMMRYDLYYKERSREKLFPIDSTSNIYEFHLNYKKKDLALQVTVTNAYGDDAYEAKLVGSFPDALSYSGIRSSQNTPLKCNANHNGSEAECELGNPFKRDSKIELTIILNTEHMTLDTTEIEIGLQLQTTSVQANISPVKVKIKVIFEMALSVSSEANPSQVTFGGVVKGETGMKSEEEIGNLISYTFSINNVWKSLGPISASLHIHWPKYNKDGKWLLYLVKITSKGPEKIRCFPESEIDPLKYVKESSVSRAKREILQKERKSGGKISYLTGRNKVLSCEREIRCVVIQCPLQGLDGTAVELRSRLWNSTFAEEYATFSTVHLVVKASLVLHTQAQNMILRTPDTTVTVTVSPNNPVAQYGVPWWIILVAVLAGILILALMVFLLWKCGFFKRATKEQCNAAYHQAEIHAQPSDKDKLSAEA